MSPQEYIQSLVEKCPLYPDPLPTCVFKKLRNMEPPISKEQIDSLSDTEIEYVIRMHLQCVNRKHGRIG